MLFWTDACHSCLVAHFDLQSQQSKFPKIKTFSFLYPYMFSHQNNLITHLTLLQIRLSFWRLIPLVWSCGRSHKLSRAPPRWWWVSSGRKARRTCWCTAWALPWTGAGGNLCVNYCWRARNWDVCLTGPAEPSPASPLRDHQGKVASQSHHP